MIWQLNVYAHILFVTALIALGGAIAAWQRRPKPGAVPLSFLMLGMIFWSIGHGLEVAVADVPGKLFWSKFQYLGVVTVPTLWLVLVLQFTGLDRRWLTRRTTLLLTVVPLMTLLLAWTNQWHHLIWAEVTTVSYKGLAVWDATYGLGFWFYVSYSYVLLLMGVVFLLRAAMQFPKPYRDQALILLLGGFVPWVGNGFSILDIINVPIDLTTFGFIIAGFMGFWGLFQYALLDLAPVVRETLVDSMDDAMIAVDEMGRIVDVNQAAVRLFGNRVTGTLGQAFTELLPQYQAVIQESREISPSYEIQLGKEDASNWYDVKVSALYDHRRTRHGHLIVLRNISERKRLEASLEAQVQRVNQLLEVARATTQSPSLEATMRNALEVALSITQSEGGLLLLLSEQQKVFRSTYLCELTASKAEQESFFSAMQQGFVPQLLHDEETMWFTDREYAPTWFAQVKPSLCLFHSALGVPIRYGEKLLGGLLLFHMETQHFAEDEVTILEIAARQMALGLANALVFEKQRIVATQQATLFNALQALQSPMTSQQAMAKAGEVFANLTDWPLVALLTSDEQGLMHLETAHGPLAARLREMLRDSQQHMPRSVALDAISRDVFPSLLLVPLKGEQRWLLLVASNKRNAFDEDARLLANSLATVAALVLRNAALYESVSTEQQRLAAVIQASRDGIILVAHNSEILVINQTAVRYLGLGQEPWLHRQMGDALRRLRLYAPEAVRATLSELRRLQRGDLSPGEGEYEVRGRTIRWVNLAVTSEDQSLGRLLILRDVTEDRQLEQMRDDLIHTMVHDLRNPLTNIYTVVGVLNKQLQPYIPEEYHSILAIAQRSTQQLLDLVNAILDISRLESGRMPLEPQAFSPLPLSEDVMGLVLPQATERRIELINEIPADLPPVRADYDLIRRVLQNLIGNALKFTPPEGQVRLSARLSPDGSDKVLFSVSDTGPGIPETIRDQLFQKFVTGLQEQRGSGLGLTFCRMVIEAHQERIWAEREVEQGATFTFSLPIVQDTS